MVVSLCTKKILAACFHHYLSQAKFNFEVCTYVFCCTSKDCCAKFCVGNHGQATRWDSDGPSGPTLFLIVKQCYGIGGLQDITGPSTTVGKVIMGKLVQ